MVNWKNVKGKKVPVDPSGRAIRDLNSEISTLTLAEATRAVDARVVDGIGLQILGSGKCGLDFDYCVVDGEIAQWAVEILERCDSYAEFSPSGTGIHIYMRGTPKCGDRRQIAVGSGHIDIFSTKGYLTLTGRPIPGFREKPVRNGASLVDEIYAQLRRTSPVIKKLRKNKKALRLLAGDVRNYESHSEADLAFVRYVAKIVGNDEDLIMEVIRQSGLYRDKWDRDSYRIPTIQKVLGASGEDHRDNAIVIDRLICSVADFLEKDIPPPEWLIEGLLEKGTINMVFGAGGVGKSHFLYSMLKSLDLGEEFMYWSVNSPRRVLYIDTEMPERLIQKRMAAWYGPTQPNKSKILSSRQFRSVIGSTFHLDHEQHQNLLRAMILEFGTEVVIIDPLAPALDCDENSNNDVGLYMGFLTELRDDGTTIILSHHTGKSEESGQRGASRRRDYLDTNIRLANAKILSNARFSASFDKVREENPKPPTWTSELMWEEAHFWKLSGNLPTDDKALMSVLQYIYHNPGKLNVTKMAKDLNIVRERCYDVFRRAYAQELMSEDDKSLTDKGHELAEEFGQESNG